MQATIPGAPGEWFQVTIELKENRQLIGDCAFCVSEEDEQQAIIGFTLSGAFQGQGLMTEAVYGLLDYLFDELKLHRISAVCDVENTDSSRLLERIGMRKEGSFIENVWQGTLGQRICLCHTASGMGGKTKRLKLSP